MTFNTYYINLKQDKQRNQETIAELNKTNLIYQRFEGTDGNVIDRQKYLDEKIIYNFCKIICTNKTIGCGISHVLLYKHIQKYDKNKFCLILEDDILVTNPELNYTQEINDIVNKYNIENPTWEIIRLHSFAFGMGSAAAQIINLKYIDKFAKTTLYYYNDIQQSFMHNIINLNFLFNTRDDLIHYNNLFYNIYFDNQKIGFYFKNHVFRIFNIIIRFYHVIFFLLFILLYNIIRKIKSYSKCRNKIPV